MYENLLRLERQRQKELYKLLLLKRIASKLYFISLCGSGSSRIKIALLCDISSVRKRKAFISLTEEDESEWQTTLVGYGIHPRPSHATTVL
jgi:hypothetical protein